MEADKVAHVQDIWSKHYQVAEEQLKNMSHIKGVITGFNVNIDAVIKIQPSMIEQWVKELKASPEDLLKPNTTRSIKTAFHFLQAYL